MGAGDHDVSEALYFNDPDGNGIEVYRDRPSNEWEWNNGQVKMGTEEVDAQAVVEEGKGHKWNVLPLDTVMGHIHLQVSDLKAVEEFYGKGLGFDVVCRYGNQALFISNGGYHHHIGLNTWNSLGALIPSKNSVGLKWFSLEFSNEEERTKILIQLKNIGAAIEKVNDHYMTEDPSGNHILLRVH
jgi:catechol 2,3-dioxygenase